ncbi:hypothetical protein BJX96DRAFT_143496 [Aspergillus floccosus]
MIIYTKRCLFNKLEYIVHSCVARRGVRALRNDLRHPKIPLDSMSQSKKVAIIGAGPSGLVAAKTLLHNFPEGTFTPVVFEKQHHIGGLWPTEDSASVGHGKNTPRGLIYPQMRTNLSRFTVSFSDFAWESVIEGPDVPMFPRAWQVGSYLEKYKERYLSGLDLRLGQEVVRAVRQTGDDGSRVRWDVQWTETGTTKPPNAELFDYLIVASGYFARPSVPDISGLDDVPDSAVHSSALHTAEDIDRLLKNSDPHGPKIVVIGASMSGVETASALALHLSSQKLSSQSSSTHEVHHICSRPFWTVPYYVPHSPASDPEAPSNFFPLDLAFYDLDRRPPGPVEYGFGPVSGTQASKTNAYFRGLLGRDYEDIGSVGVPPESGTTEEVLPSWVAIGDDYAEYVRAGSIKPTLGRVLAITRDENGTTTVNIERDDQSTVSLNQVGAIVLATGFTPYVSLSFLPADVLLQLEHCKTDPFIPLVLDGKGTSHAEVPELGFVGFYRGPYWGVMEMQARSLGEKWFRAGQGIRFSDEELAQKQQERQKVGELRAADPRFNRAQFPMGDYVGLMESFARDLGIERTPLKELGERRGPVVPARYLGRGDGSSQANLIITSLRDTLSSAVGCPVGVAAAVFRALHGRWNFSRTYRKDGAGDVQSGTLTFYPRYPSVDCDKEYVGEEIEDTTDRKTTRSLYQLVGSRICISPEDPARHSRLELQFPPALSVEGENLTCSSCAGEYTHMFCFKGVVISSWERTTDQTRTVYTR